jgi:hypothetical protein
VVIVGFTGTRKGMTDEQWERVYQILMGLEYEEVHQGDCIGADADFFVIVYGIRQETGRPCTIHAWPSTVKGTNTHSKSDIIHDPLPPLVRDKIMVERSDLLIACPKGDEEEVRSGTWTTVRYARKHGIRINIVWPDGSVTEEAAKENRLE